MERIALSPSQYQMSRHISQCEINSTTCTQDQPDTTAQSTEEKKQSKMSSTSVHTSNGSQKKQSHGSLSRTDLLYTLVQAEAGNQDLDGCRLVADVVLNRVADSHFPNTIEQVVYAPGQFSVVHNGALAKAQGNISQNAKIAVDMELSQDRLNTDILYFNNRDNGGWKHGGHWFK